ncbi:hypothetical protein COV20_01725 [Candidatus Woesearchaeota archaeon CG10_big_fil_rev_8_21_14_0_10_45_16]|nr:MAG: hypothetical protein COV20_01725 [Candidatus Woesearchaeota archaeon CG10_big_fil_rev_8_21_14_0_10_45_16]
MDRRQFLTGLAALAASVPLTGIAQVESTYTLERLLDVTTEAGIHSAEERTELVAGYDPKQDYSKESSNLLAKIKKNEVLAYGSKKSLALISWEVPLPTGKNVSVSLTKERTILVDGPSFSIEMNKRFIFEIGGSYNDFRNPSVDRARTNQAAYVALDILQKVYHRLEKSTWKDKPWRMPSEEIYQSERLLQGKPEPRGVFDHKTKELVFYGTEWCHPCTDVAMFLIKEKIRFREENETRYGRAPILVTHQEGIVFGKDEIIDFIKKAYNLPK